MQPKAAKVQWTSDTTGGGPPATIGKPASADMQELHKNNNRIDHGLL